MDQFDIVTKTVQKALAVMLPDVFTRLKAELDKKQGKESGKGLFSGSYSDLTDKPSIGGKTLGSDTSVSVTGSSPVTVSDTGDASSVTYTVALSDSGVTAGSKGDAASQTPAFGGTFKALSGTVDATGRLTAFNEHTVTVPDAAATQNAAGLMSAADKAKLDGVETGAQANVLEGITVNGNAVTPSGKTAALTVPTKVSDVTNDSGFQTSAQVEAAIDAKVSSAYKAGGSATMATLPALTAAKLGVVVNLSEDFTTTADFLEGVGKTYPAGTNVVVAEASENVYKYDVLAGFVDLSGKQDKLSVTGSATKGVYVSASGVMSPMTYAVNKDVPADAVFTDTTYTPASALPLMDGASAVGTASKYAREDHVHPVDTSRASAADVAALQAENALLRELINGIDAAVYRTVSGDPATFGDGYAANVRTLKVTITPKQSGTGDPSPTNVRPITGVSSVAVTRTGKNLLPFVKYQPKNELGVYFQVSKDPSTALTLPAGTYAFSYGTTGNDAGPFVIYWTHTTGSSFPSASPKGTGYSCSVTLSQTEKVRFNLYRSGTAVPIDNIVWAQLERGANATAYEAYQGQTLTVPLVDSANNNASLTVYGGILDVPSGTLTVTHGEYASYNGESLPGVWLSDRDVYAAGTSPTTGAQVVYELATPVTYTLTAQNLAALSGENVIYADAGSVEVEYRSDTALVLEELTNAILSLGGNV